MCENSQFYRQYLNCQKKSFRLVIGKHFKISAISINNNNSSKLFLMVFYSSPSRNINIFFEQIEELLRILSLINSKFVTIEDFNVDVLMK